MSSDYRYALSAALHRHLHSVFVADDVLTLEHSSYRHLVPLPVMPMPSAMWTDDEDEAEYDLFAYTAPALSPSVLVSADDAAVGGVTYSLVSAPVERDCAICMERIGVGGASVALSCAHSFHPRCIDVWLTRARTCPECRRRVCL